MATHSNGKPAIALTRFVLCQADAGAPLHYVGAQCHDDLSFYTDFPGYIDAVKRYSRSIVDLGVQWHFTEITVGLDEEGGDFMTEEEQETQGRG